MSDKPAIPEPVQTLPGVFATLQPMKEAIEMLQGQRGTYEDTAVTWGDLVNLGLIQPDQIPPELRRGQVRG